MAARGAVVGLVALGLVAGGAYVADEFARGNAEDLAADVVTQQVQVDGPLDVTVGGFPFLTQYLRGSLDDVRGTAASVVLEGVTVTDVDVALADLTVAAPYRVGELRVDATVPTSSVQQVVGERTALQVAVEGDHLRATGDLLGLPLSVALLPRVQDGELVIDVQEVALGAGALDLDQLPGDVAERFVGMRVPLDGLPAGVVLTDAQVVPEGVRFTATGTDVVLEQP